MIAYKTMKMINLKKGLCPKCGVGALYKKMFKDEVSFMMRCDECIFVIGEDRYEYLMATLKEDEYHIPDVEENLKEWNGFSGEEEEEDIINLDDEMYD